jgi:hypothetical protein
MPRRHLPFSWFHLCWTAILGWSVGYLLSFVPIGPKLLPQKALDRSKAIQKERAKLGLPQRMGVYPMDCVEIDQTTTEKICKYAHSAELTVGSMILSCLFVALAKRYFQEHPESKSLSLPIPLPVNMRKFMIPPLPPTVLAPQQGVLSISCYIQRDQLEQSLSNKASTIELLKKQALLSKNQVQNALFKNVPTRFKPLDAPLLAAAMYRTHLNKFWTVQYVSNDVLFCVTLFWSYVNLTFIFFFRL